MGNKNEIYKTYLWAQTERRTSSVAESYIIRLKASPKKMASGYLTFTLVDYGSRSRLAMLFAVLRIFL